jgi:hypothetical protein
MALAVVLLILIPASALLVAGFAIVATGIFAAAHLVGAVISQWVSAHGADVENKTSFPEPTVAVPVTVG